MLTNQKPLEPGARIYNRGDMANPDGWLTVTKVYPPDRWNGCISYDLAYDEGDRDCGSFQRDVICRLADSQISRVDQGNGLTRFVTEEARHTFRTAQLAEMQARYALVLAKGS